MATKRPLTQYLVRMKMHSKKKGSQNVNDLFLLRENYCMFALMLFCWPSFPPVFLPPLLFSSSIPTLALSPRSLHRSFVLKARSKLNQNGMCSFKRLPQNKYEHVLTSPFFQTPFPTSSLFFRRKFWKSNWQLPKGSNFVRPTRIVVYLKSAFGNIPGEK